ncbi:MAG: hypothetical protein K2X07_12500 [Caulobacteraceae bacterium]|nr:hypothetical protein [Caulobacteraceae bacterium]
MSADRNTKRRTLLLVAAATGSLWGSTAFAQTAQGAQAPENYAVDGNSIDVIRGTFNHSATDVAIGPQQGGLAYTRTIAGEVRRGNLDGLIEVQVVGEVIPGQFIYQYSVSIGSSSSLFQSYAATTMDSLEADGATLSYDGTGYTFTDAAGTVSLFNPALANPLPPYASSPPAGPGGRLTRMTKPNGERWDWYYRSATIGSAIPVHRVQSVTNTLGYQVKFEYAFNGTPTTQAELDAFGTTTKALAINNTVDWCDPTGDTCGSLTQNWPQAQYQTTNFTGGFRLDVTNALSQTTGYVFGSEGGGSFAYLTEIDWPEPGRASTTLTYSGEKVVTYSDGRGTWNYSYVPSGTNFQETTVTDPNAQATIYRARLRFGPPPGPMGDYTEMQRLTWFQDPTGARTYTQYDENARLIGVTAPQGNKVEYTRDGRGNITEMRRIAKPSAPAPTLTSTWTYSNSCTNRFTCNLPTSATDARGNTTDYVYDQSHGGLLTETRPAAALGQDRPQTRYTYQALQAWRRTSSSSTQVAAPAVMLPVQVSACASGIAPSCVGTAQEVRTTTAYQAGNSSTGSNLLPVSLTAGAGDGSLLATTTTTWDSRGDKKTVDGPLPGTADTTWYAYDALRRNVGVIASDPDGAGPLPFPATRTVFNADGQPIEVEQGSATAQSDAALASMTVLSEVVTAYDAQGRKVKDTQVLGTGTISVTQYSYDNKGRLICTAVRMNPAAFGSLPSDVCALGAAGTFGDDRISRNGYDTVDRLTQVETGVGTTVAQVSRLQNWTANGKLDWVQDANQNRSEYAYDGFDRLLKLEFPLPTLGAQAANPNDYEQYGYDANDNLTSRRLRDGQEITFNYDALNRETVKNVPGYGGTNDVATGYDLLDRRLTAAFLEDFGVGSLAWTWDALGRPTSESQGIFVIGSAYDLAGRRTRMTLPSGHGVDFEWDLADRMTMVWEASQSPSGPALFASYQYDALGRRTSLARGNGVLTSWSYVSNSRDWSMTHDLSGAADDVTYAFAFNPAGQAVSRDVSNPAYQFAMPTQAATPYVRDGLNQYDAVNGVAFTHDLRGNLTSDGATTWQFDAENKLQWVYGPTVSTRTDNDPIGRLRTIHQNGVVTVLLWDGDRLVGQLDGSGNWQARWAHGPGPDEPLAEWLSPTARTWLLADHQGSIVGETGVTGALTGTPFTYDPYGRPDAARGFAGSRFRYTGQIMITPEVDLWHYKARVYDPDLGRFLQTDPVGYEEGLNLYAYVGNDPFNGRDPTGMFFDDFDMWNEIGGSFGGDRAYTTRQRELARRLQTGQISETAIAELSNAVRDPVIPPPPPNLPGGPYSEAGPGQRPGHFYGPRQPAGPRAQAQWVPSESQGGPPGSRGYWKVQVPGQNGWSRFDQRGRPITANQAHPGSRRPLGVPPFLATNPWLAAIVAGGAVLFWATPAH